MEKVTPEQMAEFEKWKKENEGKQFDPETLKGVVEDDIKEAEEKSNNKESWSRNYNHKPLPTGSRSTAELDKE
jgi:hypothetical protein